MPRVSVLTPIYNTKPEHLCECIESILAQTFTDFEFLILNDSPANIALDEVVARYKDSRIKYIKNTKNLGISETRNKLIHLARGEYLAIFDHDDISVPTRLAQQVEYLDANPAVGVVSGWLEYFGHDTCIWRTPENDFDIKVGLTANCSLAHTAAMMRKSVLIDNNIEYESFYSPAEDYRLWARLMDVTKFHNLQTVLVKYRCFDKNTSVTLANKMEAARTAISLELRNKYPAYYQEYVKYSANGTIFRLRLFGFIPFFKVKNNWVQLFECIPLFKTKWK